MILFGLAIGFLIPVGKPVSRAAEVAPPYDRPYEVRHDTILARAANGHFYTDALVNGKQVRFVVDTGATNIALTLDDARTAGIQVDPSKFEVVGTGASGAVTAQVVSLAEVDLVGKRAQGVKAMVLQGLEVSLLGQNYLRQLRSVEINADTMTLH
ncbi:MAG TPA: TIGR02281 family clan AA aspartic protease [Sphingomonas sp.]|nr:TIGR02281 family clan AA aspartic protease [Sphingomonas sp.]